VRPRKKVKKHAVPGQEVRVVNGFPVWSSNGPVELGGLALERGKVAPALGWVGMSESHKNGVSQASKPIRDKGQES